ncbi:hypothetical protein MAR_002086, partial [Mya arenaria]
IYLQKPECESANYQDTCYQCIFNANVLIAITTLELLFALTRDSLLGFTALQSSKKQNVSDYRLFSAPIDEGELDDSTGKGLDKKSDTFLSPRDLECISSGFLCGHSDSDMKHKSQKKIQI